MSRSSFLVFIFCLISIVMSGQRDRPRGADGKSMVMGKVINAGQEPVPFANVAFYQKSDSAIVEVTATDDAGMFKQRIAAGEYLLKISFLGFEELSQDINLKNQPLRLGQITLEEKSLTLDEVVVSQERTTMELKLDKRVFNVGQDLRNAGGNASDLLDNLPSIDVDVEGNVSLRGSQNVRILINGKPSGLVGLGENNGLRNIQTSLIERVEVITNPSAKYEAEGEAGIINLILKKDKRKGVNGSIDVFAGVPQNFGGGLNLNYRQDKVNLFTNLNYRNSKRPGNGSSFQQLLEGDQILEAYKSEREHTRGGQSYTAQLGMDYFITPSVTLTVSSLYRFDDGENEAILDYTNYNGALEKVGGSSRKDLESEISNNVESSLNLIKTFGPKDHKLSFDIKYDLNDELEKSDIVERFENNELDLFQRLSNTEDQENILLQSDYTRPLGEDGKFESGVRMSLRTIDNAFNVEQRDTLGVWNVLSEFDDQMIYDENIYAAYSTYAQDIGKFSYQLGIRAEYSDIKTALLESDYENPRDYLDWFPSAHFTYKLSEENQFQLGYSRRISRPRFRHLLPFATFSDARSRWRGNPDLNPEYTNSIETGFLRYFQKGSLLSTIYYRHRTGVIERITEVDENNNSEKFPINLSTQNAFGLELSANYDLAKWWSINMNVNLYHAKSIGEYEGQNFDNETVSMRGRFNTKMKLKKSWNIQNSLTYRAPRNNAQGRSEGVFSWDVSLSKDVLNKKGLLTLNVRDVLNSRQHKWVNDTDTFYSENEFQWSIRSFNIGFNYLINQDRKRSRSKGEFQGGEGDEF